MSSVVGALYCFPKLDPDVYHIKDDEQFVIDLLRAKKILVTHGTGFNWFEPDHFRLVTLPDMEILTEAIGRIGDFLSTFAESRKVRCIGTDADTQTPSVCIGRAGLTMTMWDARSSG